MKAALDSSKKRKLSWNTDSGLLRREGIPDTFEFNGFAPITNLKFDNVSVRSKTLDAIIRKMLSFGSLWILPEKVLRCKQIVADGMLNEYQFTKEQQDDVMDFLVENKDKMREISLRMVTKLADLKKSMGDKWKRTGH